MTPVALLLPSLDEVFFYRVVSKVTSDTLVDCLTQWWESVHERFAHISTLVLNLDNGPENHSRRTQFMQRMVDFAHQYRLRVRLAFIPLTIVSTIRLKDAGGSWKITGMERFLTLSKLYSLMPAR